MTITEINNLQVIDVYDTLMERLALLELVEPTEEMTTERNSVLLTELGIYKAELIAEEEARIKLEALAFYVSIKEEADIGLTASNTIDEILAQIEVVELRNSVIAFNALTLLLAIKPELNTELSSIQIRELIKSLENEEAYLIEQARVAGIHTRLDAIKDDLFESLKNSGNEKQNTAWFRNHTIVEMDHTEAENLLMTIEAQAIAEKIIRLKREDLETLEEDGMKAELLCKRIYRMIVGYNSKFLTLEQFPTAVAQYGLAQSHLRNYWPSEAKKEIEKTIENDVYPQDFKDKMLEVFAENGY